MISNSLNALFDEVLEDRRLLSHPFYVRWENGELKDGELADYASQYRHFEALLPSFLSNVSESLDGEPKAAVLRNLADELGNPSPHLELFDDFLEGVSGSKTATVSEAMEKLLNVYRNVAIKDPMSALSALGSYEIQASDISRSKAEGLRRHYEIDEKAVKFWDVHATMDADHGAWTITTISGLVSDENDLDDIRIAASEAADAWWSFLDERETLSHSF